MSLSLLLSRPIATDGKQRKNDSTRSRNEMRRFLFYPADTLSTRHISPFFIETTESNVRQKQ